MWTLYRCRQLRIRNWHQTEQADRQKSKQVQPINLLFGWSDFRKDRKWMREKMMFLVVWLRVKRGKILAGFTSFLSSPLKHNISKFKRNKSEKWEKKKKKRFGQHCPHFFFWLPQPSCKCGLPTYPKTIACIFLGWLFASFFFFFFFLIEHYF